MGDEGRRWRQQPRARRPASAFVSFSSFHHFGGSRAIRGGSAGTFATIGADSIFQTRAGIRRVRGALRVDMSLGMSRGGTGGVCIEKESGSDENSVSTKEQGVIIGAVSASSVRKLGFSSEKREDGRIEAGYEWIAGDWNKNDESKGREELDQERESPLTFSVGRSGQEVKGTSGLSMTENKDNTNGKNLFLSAGVRQDPESLSGGQEVEGGGEEEMRTGLGSRAADFGLFENNVREELEGAGGGSSRKREDDSFVGLDFVQDEADIAVGATGNEARENKGTDSASTEGSVDRLSGEGFAVTNARVRKAVQKLVPSIFFGGLRRLGRVRRMRYFEYLEMTTHAAGEKMYRLSNWLAALPASVRRSASIASGRGVAIVTAALRGLEPLPSMLMAVEDRGCLGRPGEIRRAAKAAERHVQEAERAVEEHITLLDDMGQSV